MSAAADVTQEAENIKPLNLLKEHGTGGLTMTVIEFAEKRYKECCENEEYEDARYWAAYLDGARAQKKES